MSYEKYLSEVENQNNKCLICNTEMSLPNVDHDHITGKYRGLLCGNCNMGLGIHEDKKDLFEKYLNEVTK